MAGKGSYSEAQKKFVREEVREARVLRLEPNAARIADRYNEHFEPKREPHEIASLIRLLFYTGRRRRPRATEPKRRGRPPKAERKSPEAGARTRRETPKGRVLTEELEEAIVRLSGECVEVSRRINFGHLEAKIIAGFPDLKGRVGYNLLRSVLRRHGAVEAVARGDRPEMAGKMPEDVRGRIRAEIERVNQRLISVCDERERLLREGNHLNREAEALGECLQILAVAKIGEEGASAPATTTGAPSSDETQVVLSGGVVAQAASSADRILSEFP